MAMRILVVGAGAVGGYFGGRLAHAGRNVTFLVRPGRAKQLAEQGIRIISPHGDAVIRPKLVNPGAVGGPYDVVFLSVKAYALQTAIDDLAPAVGPNTMILPVLNGMRHIDILAQRFGEAAVIGGVCWVVTEIDTEGRIVQTEKVQQLVYGERSHGPTPRLAQVDTELTGSGFDARPSSDITQEMWEKWVALASLGAINCLMRGTIGEIVAAPGGAALPVAMLDECAAVASACGHKPSQALLERRAAAMTTPGSPMTSSMYRDLRKGAPVEADQILGDLVERGQRHGVSMPLLTAAFVNLRIYQAALAKDGHQ